MKLKGAFALLLAAACGCSGSASEKAEDSGSATGNEMKETQVEILTVPAGYPLLVELQTELTTETASGGEVFSAVLLEPVLIEGVEVAPAGARVTGEVTHLVKPEDGAKAKMTLEMTRVGGFEVDARPLTLEAEGSTQGDLEKVAAGGVAGGIIGGILGGTKGAAVGAGVGAGAGAVIAVATRDDHIRLDSGQKIRFELARSLNVEKNSIS